MIQVKKGIKILMNMTLKPKEQKYWITCNRNKFPCTFQSIKLYIISNAIFKLNISEALDVYVFLFRIQTHYIKRQNLYLLLRQFQSSFALAQNYGELDVVFTAAGCNLRSKYGVHAMHNYVISWFCTPEKKKKSFLAASSTRK